VSEGIPYFKVAEMNLPGNECVLKHTSLYVSKAATIKKFPKGTIVFPKNGGAMLTNKKRILGQESVCDLNTGGLKSYIEDMTDYLLLWFVSIDLGKYVKGGVIPTTDVDKLRTTPIPIPPLAEQKRIVKKVDELKEMIRSLVAL
jgi:type I restriction enzyme S subunit